jgi:hypothetical protein
MSKYRQLFVALFLLMYVGQGFATAHMTCQNMAATKLLMEQAAKPDACPDHAKQVENDASASSNSSDCCPHCDCILGGCPTAALPVFPPSSFDLRSSLSVDGFTESTLSQFTLSLFRPPIAR